MTKFKELCRQCTRNGNHYACECCTESINENCIFVTNFRLATEEEFIKTCSNCKYANVRESMQPCQNCMDVAISTGKGFSKWEAQ